MRLAISNIAWEPSEDEEVVELLRHYQVDAVDIAPSKYFSDLSRTTNSDITNIRSWWGSRQIEVTGMQSLLFGTSGLNMFGSIKSSSDMLDHLKNVCRVGSLLGATRLVFGSPRNRDKGDFSEKEMTLKYTNFFCTLGDIAQAYGVCICLEPNPTCYNSNFMTDTPETAKVVRTVNHPSIRMQLDTGAITINQEDPHRIIQEFLPLFGHIHASEPQLVTLGDGTCNHQLMGSVLRGLWPDALVSIEMVGSKSTSNLPLIDKALRVATAAYLGPFKSQTGAVA